MESLRAREKERVRASKRPVDIDLVRERCGGRVAAGVSKEIRAVYPCYTHLFTQAPCPSSCFLCFFTPCYVSLSLSLALICVLYCLLLLSCILFCANAYLNHSLSFHLSYSKPSLYPLAKQSVNFFLHTFVYPCPRFS